MNQSGYTPPTISYARAQMAIGGPPLLGSPFRAAQRFTGKPVNQDEPVFGWRSYMLTPEGYLQGSRMEWRTRTFEARCERGEQYPPQFVKEIFADDELYAMWLERRSKNEASRIECLTHLANDSCPSDFGCGIWGRANPDMDGAVLGRCLAYGTVAVDEDGNWRASDVQIETLYLNRPGITQNLGAFACLVDWTKVGYDLSARYGVPVQVIDSLGELSSSPIGT